jgi:membrane-bound lytic murein transglycosylase A
LAALAAAVALASCATQPAAPVQPLAPPRGASATLLPLSALPGWSAEDHVAAFELVRLACARAPASERCQAALAAPRPSEVGARAFLEANFRAQSIAGEGLLTAYFSPSYPARLAPDAEFSAAVRPRPADPAAAGDRATIERRPAPDALAWMRPEDLFSLQVQGSGVLVFPDGARRRAAFAGANGAPYVAISGPMATRGLLGPDRSASAVRGWLASHRGAAAGAVMDLDPRYVFFRLAPDDGEPAGSAGVPLIAGRSLAVDPESHGWFELLWVDADAPMLPGAHPTYRRLALALDSGAAIKGPARADLYLGQGEAAGEEAGRVRHALRLYRVVPASR